ncbi:MAG: hypothetical protein ABGX23_03885 [Nautiliaceae bacterium]
MRVFLSLLVVSYLFALNPNKMNLIELYKRHYYTYICVNRWKFIKKYKDEDLLSLVAASCVKKHMITPGIDVAKVLRFTKIGRNNANYLSTLFLIKHYIISYIKDGFDLKNVNLPLIKGDLIGKIFILLKAQKPKVKDNSFVVVDGSLEYKVVVNLKRNLLYVYILNNGNLIKKDRYW